MRPKRRASIPLGLAGMLLLVAGVESGVSRYVARSFRFESTWVWDATRRQARSGNEILCFGDSQIKNSVLPAVIEARLGRKAYNLAQNGSQVPGAYLLFRRALESGANPDAVVVGFNPALLSRGCDRRSACWLGLAGPRDWPDLVRDRKHPERIGEMALTLVSPTARERLDLRSEILSAIRGEPNAPGSSMPRSILAASHRRNWALNRGAQALPDYNVPRDPETWYRVDYPAPWACDPMIAGYLDRFLALAESRGISVYWLLHPVDPEGQSLLDRNGQEDRFGRFLADLLRRHRNLVLIDGHHSHYDRSAFLDMVHLHDRGAYALTSALADVLGDDSTNSRVRALPFFQARTATIPIEDLNRSIVAVRERIGREKTRVH